MKSLSAITLASLTCLVSLGSLGFGPVVVSATTPSFVTRDDAGAPTGYTPPPMCAGTCLGHAQTAQFTCPPVDTQCFCTDLTIQNYLQMCITKSCPDSDLSAANATLQAFCGAFASS